MRKSRELVRVRTKHFPDIESFLCDFIEGDMKLLMYSCDRGISIIEAPGPDWELAGFDSKGFTAQDGTYLERLDLEAMHPPKSIRPELDASLLKLNGWD